MGNTIDNKYIVEIVIIEKQLKLDTDCDHVLSLFIIKIGAFSSENKVINLELLFINVFNFYFY
jgi:hypothetical protein